MLKRTPLGIHDFKEMITENYYYVDKTLLVQELLLGGSKVTLIPRPRRFGKTVNISMLKYFFEKTAESQASLFEGLKISHDAQSMKHQGQYPVIFITLKDVKGSDWKKIYSLLSSLIAAEYKRHRYLLDDTLLDEREKQKFLDITEENSTELELQESLKNLTAYLARYYKKRAVVLIDEYDTPIHSGFSHNYYKEIVGFMSGFLGSCLKDNENLGFAVMTGILRVAKESIFSGLNNLETCTFLNDAYGDKFGLVQDEVDQILNYYGLDIQKEAVRAWYNGYQSGQHRVYNPWSIIQYIKNNGELQPYWINTSNNDIIINLINQSDATIKADFEQLLSGKSVTKHVNENVVFATLHTAADAVWSLLLFSGYLTFSNKRLIEQTRYVDIHIPNEEILYFFKTIVINWFKLGIRTKDYNDMINALMHGDAEQFKISFADLVSNSLSFFDVDKKEPERVYHAIILGMLVGLTQTHELTSNRESGYGRYDIMLIPKDPQKTGIIIEFKKVDQRRNETLATAAQGALDQIEKKKYERELINRGINRVLKIGVAFEGKEVEIVWA